MSRGNDPHQPKAEIRDIGDDLQSGSLELELTNRIPVGVSVIMLVSGDLDRRKPNSAFYDTTGIPINDSLEFIKMKEIEAAETDQAGYAAIAKQKTVSLNLTKEQLRILTNPPYRVGYALKIHDSQGSFAIRPVDFVRSRGLAKLIVKVEDE